jgi:PAS domain S-box-containing protein
VRNRHIFDSRHHTAHWGQVISRHSKPRLPLATIENTTERQAVEDVLLQSEALLRSLIRISPSIIRILDADGVIRYESPAVERALGYQMEELIGLNAFDFLHPDDVSPTCAAFCEALKDPALTPTVEYRFRHKDGSWRWHEATAANLLADPAVGGLVVSSRDITEWRHAEEATQHVAFLLALDVEEARRARGVSRAVLDAASEAMIFLPPDHGEILSINERFREFFGEDSDILIGRPVGELRAWAERFFDDPSTVGSAMLDNSADNTRRVTKFVTQHSPEHRSLQLYASPVLSTEGEDLGRLFAFRDITREREIHRVQSEFISLVSHELRTPLTTIKGYIDVFMDGDLGSLPTEQKNFLRIASENTDRLASLINDLLDVSRIESGEVELERKPQNLHRIIGDTVESLQQQMETTRHYFTLNVDVVEPAVLGDGQRITQILTNLISNAIKYSPAGGEITISAHPENGTIQVSVTDGGIGLSLGEQSQLFSKFFRAKNATTQRTGGTGLGLAITRGLVEKLGGEISVSSAKGEGSTFTFTLPATLPNLPGDFTMPGPGAKRILLVEEDPSFSELLRFYLTQVGYLVHHAPSAEEALRLAREAPFDLITLSILLPDKDGYSVLEELKADPATAAMPVIVVTNLADDGRGRLLGATDVMRKPVGRSDFLTRVRRALVNAHE